MKQKIRNINTLYCLPVTVVAALVNGKVISSTSPMWAF